MEEDKIIRMGGITAISFASDLCGIFGEDAIMKYNNAIKRMQQELAEDHGFRVEKIASSGKATLYATAYWRARGVATDALVHLTECGDWKCSVLKCRFRKKFVDRYTQSIWGYQRKNGLETAKELISFLASSCATFHWFMSYVVLCRAGGLMVRHMVDRDYGVYLDFIPYEEIDPEDAKIITKVVLDYYANNELIAVSDKVPSQLLADIVGISEVRDENGEVIEYKLNEKQ